MLPDIVEILLVFLAVFGCFATLAYSVIKLLSSEHSVYEERAVAALGKRLSQIYVFIDPERFYHLCMVAAVGCFLLGFALGAGNLAAGVMLGAILGGLGFAVPWVVVSILLHKRLAKLEEQLPEGLDMLGSSLKANLTLAQAIDRCADKVASPMGQELRVIREEQRLGNGLVEALHHWADRTDLRDVRLIVMSSEISLRLGGDLAANYQMLSQLIRQRHMFQKEIKSLTAEGRFQAIFMAALPFIVLAIMAVISPQRMWPFITSALGMWLLLLVVVMQVGAYHWIKKITTIEF